ncbi:glycoside hydrolase family 88 protein [Desertivirga arenae]|uniref:glycoside hydrolase family 88 protein n=1 Tax=Desertivirga arenae TaxID=2810309 RepID=UPI001A95E604|nr:glycoside hydrolase family 88 protein [Pedobacter sp. SYSU D00823]
MKRISILSAAVTCLFSFQVATSSAQTKPLSERMAAQVMDIWADSLWTGRPFKWTYDQGVILEGIADVWYKTGDTKYFNYIKKSMDHFVQADGTVRTYKPDEFNIDHVKNGRSVLLLYKVTGQEKYLKAAQSFRDQLSKHPRTKEGGFWHKQVYPNQMWLDGLYMGEPFYAEYSALTNDASGFNDVANQFIWMEQHSRDPKTGLMYHGWDESKEQQWADKNTGRSPHVWGRAMGWYGVGLVDALEYFPENHPKRKELIAILNRFADAVKKVQQPNGLWYDVIDVPNGKGNYFESSAAAMFVTTIAKGVRLGYLPQSYMAVAERAYAGMKKEFVEEVNADKVNYKGTVNVSGLGGKPYRDGSFEYYMREKVITNDPKGVGAFMMAASEMEIAALPKMGKGKTVTVDSYFNNEFHKEPATGKMEPFHYIWTEKDNNGYSLLGHIFNARGAKLSTLEDAPTAANLKNSSVYIIVDPDTEKETEKPNYVQPAHVKAVSDWVKAGGVLVFFHNDAGNAEFKNFNTLANAFGINFNEVSKNRVQGSQFEQGAVMMPANHPIFKTTKKAYLKEISTLTLTSPAKPSVTHNGDVIIATAKVGKGTVFAVGDPWLYNEYTDGRKLPADFQNFKAANDLVEWLLNQAKK